MMSVTSGNLGKELLEKAFQKNLRVRKVSPEKKTKIKPDRKSVV